MDLTKLFETQRLLDAAIIEKKGIAGQDTLPDKILALQVELGECANEWRGFKFWSEDKKPRTKVLKSPTMNEEDKVYINPLLVEYVDCLHFILSISLEMGVQYFKVRIHDAPASSSITRQFSLVMGYAYLISEDDYCSQLISSFITLGEMLGFTWEQIEKAYYDKNQENHERQQNGY